MSVLERAHQALAGPENMVMGESCRGIGIATLDRLGDRGVFTHGLGTALGECELHPQQPITLLVQSLIDVERLGSHCRSVEGQVELEVRLTE